jgi:hypothetical protein
MNRNPFDPHAPAPHPYTLLSFTVSSGQANGSKKTAWLTIYENRFGTCTV